MKKIAFLLMLAVSVSAGAQPAAEIQNIDELYARLDDQEQVIKSLTGKTEELADRLDKLDERVGRMNADIDMRFQTLAKPEPKPEPKPVQPAAEQTEQQRYDAAYALMKKGDHAGAETAFRAFIRAYPKSKLAGNANYWIGETLYARGRHAEAVGVFADGLAAYKSNAKAPDNMLKLGLSLKHLNKRAEACAAFTGLAAEFPKAGDAVKARAADEAKKLACP
ncbi:MAG: tol-pal system protein YbgF [Alphaproteobacteria bacterium]|nr:tol-pal system protein YbgF [Alphaproteobacteria bacterium]